MGRRNSKGSGGRLSEVAHDPTRATSLSSQSIRCTYIVSSERYGCIGEAARHGASFLACRELQTHANTDTADQRNAWGDTRCRGDHWGTCKTHC